MKPILFRILIAILLMANCAALAPAKPADDELSLVITIITGERGRDSHSTTAMLTLAGDKLTYQQSYQGAHSGARTPIKKEYKLTTDERNELVRSMREKNLLVTRTLETLSQDDEPGSYFLLLIRSKLNGKERSITIKLPRTAPRLKADPLYQDSVALVEQLYRVIQKMDPEISMPSLIH